MAATKNVTQKGREKRAAKGAAKRGAQAKSSAKPARSNRQTRVRARAPNRAAAAKRATSAAGAAAGDDVELEAAVLRRLLQHFDERKDVQNIELMIRRPPHSFLFESFLRRVTAWRSTYSI